MPSSLQTVPGGHRFSHVPPHPSVPQTLPVQLRATRSLGVVADAVAQVRAVIVLGAGPGACHGHADTIHTRFERRALMARPTTAAAVLLRVPWLATPVRGAAAGGALHALRAAEPAHALAAAQAQARVARTVLAAAVRAEVGIALAAAVHTVAVAAALWACRCPCASQLVPVGHCTHCAPPAPQNWLVVPSHRAQGCPDHWCSSRSGRSRHRTDSDRWRSDP